MVSALTQAGHTAMRWGHRGAAGAAPAADEIGFVVGPVGDMEGPGNQHHIVVRAEVRDAIHAFPAGFLVSWFLPEQASTITLFYLPRI